MTTAANNTTPDFQSAYHTLKTNAERLESQDSIDIDALMGVVEESIAAYKVCQARIDAVESALKGAFEALEPQQ